MEPNLETLKKIIEEVKSKKFLNDMQSDFKKQEKKEFKKIRNQIEKPKTKPLF